jgi:hypothetical protein
MTFSLAPPPQKKKKERKKNYNGLLSLLPATTLR